ncbi:MAG: sigma-70 family RNA polymerase sigma factor [Oscillospiraceae bacterium]|nr:sigma-70 family RNA polymerase sigma factor [Oscillospiraceae bacterium]MDD6146610.1 sigma-70 family RNA polymerase sigma factor [Oscillospiraceae bacterium]
MQAMDEIYQSYARTVYKYLMSLTADENLAEELTQETFYQAIRSIDRFDGSCRISTWLCAIAKNQLLSYRRKHPVSDEVTEDILTEKSAEESVLDYENRVETLKKLHGCPEPYREVMYLRVYGNLSFREIGDIMGKTENWARVTFYRGKEHLRKELEKHE